MEVEGGTSWGKSGLPPGPILVGHDGKQKSLRTNSFPSHPAGGEVGRVWLLCLPWVARDHRPHHHHHHHRRWWWQFQIDWIFKLCAVFGASRYFPKIGVFKWMSIGFQIGLSIVVIKGGISSDNDDEDYRKFTRTSFAKTLRF